MSRKSDNIINVLNRLAAGGKSLTIVETGTIRRIEDEYKEGDGHSTEAICRWIADGFTYHEYVSIDIDTSTAEFYLNRLGLLKYVELISAYSTEILPDIKSIDFAYLDSANDAKNTMDEFVIVWPEIVRGGCVMVDDCNEESEELHKGDILMPYLRDRGIKYDQLDTNQIVIYK